MKYLKIVHNVCICYTIYFPGFTTDGEFNSLRTKGNTRPLSVFQIRADARAKCSRVSLNKMINKNDYSYTRYKMQFVLHSSDAEDGSITAVLPNPAINLELLSELKT